MSIFQSFYFDYSRVYLYLTSFQLFVNLAPFHPGFCIDLNSVGDSDVPCDTAGSVDFTLIPVADKTARYLQHHTDIYGFYSARMKTNNFGKNHPVKSNCLYCNIIVTNSRTNFSFIMHHVIHWAFDGQWLYFGPNVSVDVINQEFKKGDEFVMTHLETSRDDVFAHGGSALSFVHGTNPEYGQQENSFYKAKGRMRWGITSPAKDGTVWVRNRINLFQTIFYCCYSDNHSCVCFQLSTSNCNRPLISEAT